MTEVGFKIKSDTKAMFLTKTSFKYLIVLKGTHLFIHPFIYSINHGMRHRILWLFIFSSLPWDLSALWGQV